MSVISNLVERTVRSTSIRSPSALFATERGRDARTYAGETSAHPGGAWASETRAPGCHLCGRDARAPRRRLGGRDPRTRLSLMRARRACTQRRAWGRDARAPSVARVPGYHLCGRDARAPSVARAPDCHLCGRDNRAPRVPRADDCALSNRGARHAVPLLIRHQNDDMLRPSRNASYRSRSGITPIPASFFPEEEWLVRSCRIFYNLSFCKGSCDFALFPQYPNERHQIE